MPLLIQSQSLAVIESENNGLTVNAELAFWNANGFPEVSNKNDLSILIDGNEVNFELSSVPANPSMLDRDLVLMIDKSLLNESDKLVAIQNAVADIEALSFDKRSLVFVFDYKAQLIKPRNFSPIDLDFNNINPTIRKYSFDDSFLGDGSGLFSVLDHFDTPSADILVFTDNSFTTDSELLISDFLRTKNHTLSVLSFDIIYDEVKSIVANSGGHSEENLNIDSFDEALKRFVYSKYYTDNYSLAAEFKIDPDCDNSERTLSVIYGGQDDIRSDFDFIQTDDLPKLEISSTFVDFGELDQGETLVDQITVTANNYDFKDIRLVSPSTDVELTPSTFDLESGQSQIIDITFSPIDNLYRVYQIEVLDGYCDNSFEIGGGNIKSNLEMQIFLDDTKINDSYLVGDNVAIGYSGVGDLPVDLFFEDLATNNISIITPDITESPFLWQTDQNNVTQLGRIIAECDISDGKSFGSLLKEFHGPTSSINDVKVSPDKSIVAVGANQLIILDYETFLPIATLFDANDKITCIEFSDDSRYFYTGTLFGKVIKWDTSTLEILNTYSLNDDSVTDITLLQDKNQLAFSTEDGFVILIDTDSFNDLNSNADHNSRIRTLEYNPLFDEIISISESGLIYTHDANDWSVQHQDQVPFNNLYSIAFNKDLSTTAIASRDNINVYDSDNMGEPIFEYTDPGLVNTTDLFFDELGTTLIAIGRLGEITAIDTENWSIIEDFKAHDYDGFNDGIPFSLDLVPGGKTFVSAGEDGKVIEWGALFNTVVRDTSNTLSIIEPVLIINDIDLGKTVLGEDLYLKIDDYLQGITDPYISIEGFDITGTNPEKFNMLKTSTTEDLLYQTAKMQAFTFRADELGIFEAVIEIYYNGKTASANIIAEVEERRLSVETPIFFPLTEVGKQSVLNIEDGIRNNSLRNVPIVDYELLSDPNEYISVDGIVLPTVIIPNTSTGYITSFDPMSQSYSIAELLIYESGFDVPYTVTIVGRTISETIIGKINDASGAQGESINIIIDLPEADQYFITNDVLNFSIEYNPTVLTYSGFEFTQIEVDGKFRLNITITEDQLNENSQLLIPFKVALGNSETSPVSQFLDITAGSDVELGPGVFTLTELCEDGGTRLLSMSGEFGLYSIQPNPVQDIATIFLNVPAGENTDISLFDRAGNLVRVIFEGFLEEDEVIFDRAGIASGLYFLKLETDSIEGELTVVID
jgi:hypothetical protein